MKSVFYKKYDKKYQFYMECMISGFISLYFLSILGVSIMRQWPSWVPMMTGGCVLFMWVMVLGKFQTQKIRTFFVTLLLDISMGVYSYFDKSLVTVMLPFAAVIILLALYGYVMDIILSFITIIVIAIMQAFVVKSIDWNDTDSLVPNIYTIANALFICLIAYFWIRMRMRTQQNMKSTFEAMEIAQKGKDDFIANVSHEIRTPVNTISGMSDILMAESDPINLKEDLNRIRVASRNLMFVVTDILDFSELEKGVIVLEEENYNISSTINDLINMATAQASGKTIELLVNYSCDLPRGLCGDEKRIRRAIMNVVGNAYKFTEEGYVIIDISHRIESYGINLIVSIRDSGIGMKPEDLEKLFSTYNQADASRARSEGGIGLGLAITRVLVQKMGGTISVYSDYEKGTEIRIVIPQKVVDSRPIITIKEPEKIEACIFLNLEEYLEETRDEYLNAIERMREQLNVKTVFCKNLAEVKRRLAEGTFTHLFTSYREYADDKSYFDMMADKLQLVVLLNDASKDVVENQKVYQICKPFQLMPIAQALNNSLSNDVFKNHTRQNSKFIAPKVRVLVVDDNEMNIHVVGGLIKKYKITYEQALSGAEALEKIESQDYDFVFMDHMMPEMDGVECLHRIRQKSGKYYSSVPIVALTANAVAGAREMLIGEGFDDFIEKPLELSVLERLLLRILPEEKIEYLSEEAMPVEQQKVVAEEKAIVQLEATEDITSAATSGNYTYDSLNFQNGYLYCGGEESFNDIINIYANKGAKNYKPLQELFENEDWENYTISIHAVKSSMKSIGADDLSEQARLLEMAGKESRIDYILENHERVYEMYCSLIHSIMEHEGVELVEEEPECAVDLTSLPELQDDEMEQIKKELEDAMFSLDGDQMLLVLKPARGTQYHGKALDSVIKQVEQKIEMSDYMSAADCFLKI